MFAFVVFDLVFQH